MMLMSVPSILQRRLSVVVVLLLLIEKCSAGNHHHHHHYHPTAIGGIVRQRFAMKSRGSVRGWVTTTTTRDHYHSNNDNSLLMSSSAQQRQTAQIGTGTTSSFLDTALTIPRGGGGDGGEIPVGSAAVESNDLVATALGYMVGAASFGLYTPIAFRLVRQKSADGLVAATWWLKLVSYTCSDIYFFRHDYPISTYVEALVMTASSAIVLGLVTHYQNRGEKVSPKFLGCWGLYAIATVWGLQMAPDAIVAFGQAVCSNVLNVGSLLPQFALNYQTKSSGDYSPLTAGIAISGNAIRVFTTIKLNGSDPVLMLTFGLACLLNVFLLGQILWYGTVYEGKSLLAVLLGDFVSSEESGGGKKARV